MIATSTTARRAQGGDVEALADLSGRVLLVGSSGGHLAQLMVLAPLWPRDQRHWVTFDTADAVSQLVTEDVSWAHYPTTRNLPNLARNAALARRVIAEYQPDVIVSTGAGVAYPFFVLGRAKGIPTVYVEVYDRIDSRTVTGRLCRPLSTLFCVQWQEQRDLYPGSVHVGPLL
jgi:UDP-N-acetylglucosamine:LPS N-acetylglucosamine transferase